MVSDGVFFTVGQPISHHRNSSQRKFEHEHRQKHTQTHTETMLYWILIETLVQ